MSNFNSQSTVFRRQIFANPSSGALRWLAGWLAGSLNAREHRWYSHALNT